VVKILHKDTHIFIYSNFLDLAVAPVARLLHFQNIPVVTMGAVSNEFTLQRQAMYSTLFRFGYRTDELGKVMCSYSHTFEKKIR
jgi:hypothetical protein